MSVIRCARFVLPAALLLTLSVPVQATDGHLLHGVGAVNSAMGGAGVAAPGDLLGSFYLNPAGLVCEHGSRIALGFEMMKPQRSVTSEFGGFTGSTTSKSDFTPIPAFGWATRLNETLSFGVGLLGIGGFGVDYPADPMNPVLGPRPQGFGQVASNFAFMKIAPSLAWKASDRLYLGAAVNMDWASLSVDPMPIAPPAFDPGTGTAYYSRATATDGAFGFGFQAGLIYRATEGLRLGLSYSSPQWFDDFEYNAVYENPELPEFQYPREITFRMDVPAMYAGGLALTRGKLLWTGDARYVTYSRTNGFSESGMDEFGTVRGFGWEDIWVLASGLQFRPVGRIALRGGYNYTQNPIPDEQAAANIPAPAVVQHHLTAGMGITFGELSINLGYYHAFANDITGTMMTPGGPLSVTNEMYEDSFLVSFSFLPGM